LEERRKVKSAAYYEKKKALVGKQAQAKKTVKVDSKITKQLAGYGY
jgi:large subunit ribosomal protein L13Ae